MPQPSDCNEIILYPQSDGSFDAAQPSPEPFKAFGTWLAVASVLCPVLIVALTS